MVDDPLAFASTALGPTGPSGSGDEPPAASVEPGTVLGRYVVQRKIGAGGMGLVFAAHDPELDRRVALKVMQPRAAATPKRALAHVMHGLFGDAPPPSPNRTIEESRLLREAQAAASLCHPNVVTIHDVGRWERGVFIAMEFIAGQTLREWWTAEPRTPAQVFAVMRAAARGLAAAHAAGLVHRDFKPDNVMVGDDGRVLVVDFGLVRPVISESLDPARFASMDALSEELTREGTVLGTPAYMAPEQHYGSPTDARTDQFSFCATLWEGLAGRRPFRTSIPDLLDGPPRAPADETRLPRWQADVLRRGMALQPGDRYPSMDRLIAALSADPTSARRRRRTALGVGIAAALGVGGWQARDALGRHRCEQDAAQIDAIWNQTTRDRMTTSMTRTGVAYAESSATRSAEQLDSFAQAWRTTREQACLQSAFGDDPQDLVPGTFRCLDSSADALVALLEATESIGELGVRGAVSATSNLRSPAACAEPEQARRALQQAAADSEIVAEIRLALTRSSALEAMGQYDAALASARNAATQAESFGVTAELASAQYRLGVMLHRTGAIDAAVAVLERAAHGAAEVGDDDDAARAGIRLAYVLAESKSDLDGATTWARWAESYLERTEGNDEDAARNLHGELGSVYGLRGDTEQQLSHHRRQVALARAHLGDHHPGLVVALNNLAGSLTDVGNTAEALPLLEEASRIQEASLSRDHPDVAMTLTNLARLYWLAGDADAAAQASQRALEIFTTVLGPDHPRVGMSHANLALVLGQQGKGAQAIEHLERAVEIARAGGRETLDVARALANLGDAERGEGRLEAARDHHVQALRILDLVGGDDVAERASAAHGLGNDLRAMGRHDEALAQFLLARAVLEKSQPAGSPRLAIVDLQLGQTLLDLQRPAEARAPLTAAYEAFADANAPADQRLTARFALARALDADGDREAALQHARHVLGDAEVSSALRDEIAAWSSARSDG